MIIRTGRADVEGRGENDAGSESRLGGRGDRADGGNRGGGAMAIKPMVDKEGVPWVGLSANPTITNPVTPSMFHIGYTGIASGEAMATFAMSQPGIKKIALVQHSNDWAHGYCEPASAIIK